MSVLWQSGPGGMREEPLISSIYLELRVQTLHYVSTLILVQWFSSGESEWRWSETGGQILLSLSIQQYLGTFLVVTIGDASGIA